MSLPLWLEIFLLIYIYIKGCWLFLMLGYSARGEKVCQTPSDFRIYFEVSKGIAICMFTLHVLILPLYNLLFWTTKLIYWLFHVKRGEARNE